MACRLAIRVQWRRARMRGQQRSTSECDAALLSSPAPPGWRRTRTACRWDASRSEPELGEAAGSRPGGPAAVPPAVVAASSPTWPLPSPRLMQEPLMQEARRPTRSARSPLWVDRAIRATHFPCRPGDRVDVPHLRGSPSRHRRATSWPLRASGHPSATSSSTGGGFALRLAVIGVAAPD